MKHKLQTLLKHKLQWLLLLVALLGVSQGVWATWYVRGSFPNHSWDTYYALNANNSVTIALNAGNYEFKLDNGSWSDGCGKKNDNASCGSECSIQWNNGGNIGFSAPQNGNYTFTFNLSSSPSVTITCPPPTLYLRGIGSWDADAGNLMSESSGVYTITKSLTAENGVEFKICGSAWGDHEFGQGTTDNPSCDTNYTMGNGGNVHFTPTTTGSHTFTFTLSTGVLNITCPAPSCTTPTDNDIAISAPASTTTLYLGTGSAPSVTQTVTATCSKGNTYLWSATPTTYTSSSCWPGTATRVSIADSDKTSATATFYHEGEYTATFKAGCSNTTDASKPAHKITVKPGHIYFDGPFFSGSNYDLTKHHLEIDKSNDEFVYEWTATSSNTVAKNDFIISVGNQCINATTSAYDIGNYADLTLNGLVIPDEDTSGKTNCNHNFRANIGTIAVGERLKLTISYTGVNSSGVPKYTVKLEKVCSNPTVQTVSGTATICDGSSTNVTVASSQSGYTYVLYKDGSATTTTQTGGSALNFSVSEAGAYTVHAYYTSGADAYCKADMSGTATVTVDAASVAGTISGRSSSQCLGNTRTLTLKNYTGTIQWHVGNAGDFTPSSSTAISGATSEKYYAPISEVGTKYYKAVVTNGVCPAATTTTAADITVNRQYQASDFNLSGNTQYYDGDPKPVTVAEKSGAGNGAITIKYAGSTTAPTNAGTYAITINVDKSTTSPYYCPASDLSVGTLTINKANQITLTISNTATDLVYCDAANVKLTTSGGSGDGAVTYSVTSGSGSVDGDVLSPSAKGSVSVTATKAASQNYNATTSVAKTFNFNIDAPDVYTLSNVGETTTICGDPSSGAGSGTLRLSGSQTGYKYQLYSNGAPIEGYAAKAGTTGSSIDFPVTSSGTYTVYAYYGDNSTNCPTRMDGEITLTISTQPRLVRSAASVTQYMPVTITSVSTDIAEWKIVDGSGNDVSSSTAYLFDQTYDAISFKGASTNGSTAKTYTIQATTAGGCSATTTITVNPDTESCGG